MPVSRHISSSASCRSNWRRANARLAKTNERMSRDLKAAAKIQRRFFHASRFAIQGIDFAWIYRPCDELAGDGLNVIPLGDGNVSGFISWTLAGMELRQHCYL